MTIVTGDFYVSNRRVIDFDKQLIKCKRNLNYYKSEIERKLL